MLRRRIVALILCGLIVSAANLSFAEENQHDQHKHANVLSHAPIGVMGDHAHKKGEWMTSYRYMRMDMPENYIGDNKASPERVHRDYMISPLDMTMEMHMVGIMYGVSDQATAMLMIPYVFKEMDHRNRAGAEFTTKSEGLGDIQLSTLFPMEEFFELPVLLQVGVSLPTGTIGASDTTLAGPNQPLPYPMQLGSGTYDLLSGITYFDHYNNWSWGGKISAVNRFQENRRNYRLGNEYALTAWGAYKLREWIGSSLRINWRKWGNIKGADQLLNPAMVPTADASLKEGERIDAFVGINIMVHEGPMAGHRVAVEVGYPIYQHVKGPQLGTGIQTTVGWQLAW